MYKGATSEKNIPQIVQVFQSSIDAASPDFDSNYFVVSRDGWIKLGN